MLQSEESTDVQIESLFKVQHESMCGRYQRTFENCRAKDNFQTQSALRKRRKILCSMERNDMDNWISLI